jgi:XTP/dITP diphosphohydrolase
VTGWPRLVLATANQHKIIELTRILAASSVAVELLGLDRFPGAPDVAETGATFTENALLKAVAIGGMPGVLSARWAGRHGDDAANLCLLLDQLSDVPDDRRGAHFICVAAFVLPSGQEFLSEGTVHGRLIRERKGTNGFGYDPIFVPDGESHTTAQMNADDKDAISHRGRALRGLVPAIADQLRV